MLANQSMVMNDGRTNNNIDLPSNDQNMIYAYEGEGSDVGSLSSIEPDNYADKDLDYDFLRDCGPKFVKLSNIYVKNDDPSMPDFNRQHQSNYAFEFNDDNVRVSINQNTR